MATTNRPAHGRAGAAGKPTRNQRAAAKTRAASGPVPKDLTKAIAKMEDLATAFTSAANKSVKADPKVVRMAKDGAEALASLKRLQASGAFRGGGGAPPAKAPPKSPAGASPGGTASGAASGRAMWFMSSTARADPEKTDRLQRLGGYAPPKTGWDANLTGDQLRRCRKISSELASQLRSAKAVLSKNAIVSHGLAKRSDEPLLEAAEEAYRERDAEGLADAKEKLEALLVEATAAWREALKDHRRSSGR
jgi:hypothetical protein